MPPELPAAVETELRLTSRRHREDARQEAWVALLEGRDPVAAVTSYRRRELRHERHERACGQVHPLPFVHPGDN